MKKSFENEKDAKILRLLATIKNTERTIEISKKWEDDSMIKGHILLKEELVNELLQLLSEELKIQVRLENAA